MIVNMKLSYDKVKEFIEILESRGVKFWRDQNQLRFKAPSGIVNEEILNKLKENKENVLEFIKSRETLKPILNESKRYEPFLLTDIQSAYVLGRESVYEGGGIGCHGYVELTLEEILDPSRLEKAWHKVIMRHDMLRATVESKKYMRVHKEVKLPQLIFEDLRNIDSHIAEKNFSDRRKELESKQYDPEKYPLCDLALTIIENKSIIHFSLDMLIGDFISANVILSELDHFYYEPEKELPELNITFRDIREFQKKNSKSPKFQYDYDIAKKYWENKLNDLSSKIDMPMRENKKNQKVTFSQEITFLEKEKWECICKIARKNRVTPSSVILSAYAHTLGLWSKNPKFSINVTLLNRSDYHEQINQVVGDFTSVNVFGIDLKKDSNFLERTRLIQNNLIEDLAHRSFSGVEVLREVSRKQNENFIVPIVFTSTIGIEAKNNEGDFIRGAKLTYKMSQTPQVWIDCQISEQFGGILINWDVRDGIFKDNVIEEAFESFTTFINELSEEDIWSKRYPVNLPQKIATIRKQINDTQASYSPDYLHKGFYRQVTKQPNKTAVYFKGVKYSYKDIANRAMAVKRELELKGLKKGDLVGIVLEKSHWQIASVLGILLAGAAYVPIYHKQPYTRQLKILEDGQIPFVITSKEEYIYKNQFKFMSIAIEELTVKEEEKITYTEISTSDIAYIIYTSGTTGIPKGVVMTHEATLNTIEDINKRFKVTSHDSILSLANLAFDLSVYDIFGVLGAGGTIVLSDPSKENNPEHWLELILSQNVTLWNSVPAQMQMIVNRALNKKDLDKLPIRLVLLSGDWIPVTLPEEIKSICKEVQVISLGGATEAAIWSIYHEIYENSNKRKSIPYGKPLRNQTFYVLNKLFKECPNGVVGDLYIGGIGLAKEYYRDEMLTKEKFFNNPETGKRLYFTGDTGRYLENGEIEFMGRKDNQVKIRGHRIELSEIESALQNHEDISRAVAIITGDTPQEYRLNAFIEPRIMKEEEKIVYFYKDEMDDICIKSGDMATAEVNRKLFKEWIEVADKTTLYDILKTFKDAGLYKDKYKIHSFEEIEESLSLAPKFKRLLKRWLNALCKENMMSYISNKGYKIEIEFEENHAVCCWDKLMEIEAKVHYGENLVNYLRDSSNHLSELLKGDINALDIFFPKGKLDRAMAAYKDNLVNKALNIVTKDSIIELIEKHEKIMGSKPFRILEIGAGVGGTSTDIIPSIDKYNVRYHFTDLSTFFLNEAKVKFEKYPWVTYGIFDINKPYWNQNLRMNDYDLIICANVLHNARNINDTIEMMKTLLVSGGHIVIIEATKEAYTLLTSMEFKDGLSGFTDFRASTDRTFIDYNQWNKVLSDAKVEVIGSYPKSNDYLSMAGQTMFMCQCPNTYAKITAEEVMDYLKNQLPEYMIPNSIELIPSMPLTSNQKIDRKYLRNRIKDVSKVEVIIEEDVKDELEQKLIDIWSKVLNKKAIGVKENFYQMGGDSLSVAQVIANMRDEVQETSGWEWDELMREMLQTPTVKDMVKKLRNSSKDKDRSKEKKEISPLVILAEGKAGGGVTAFFHAGTGTLTPYNALLPHIIEDPNRIDKIVGLTFGNEKEYLKIDPKNLIINLGEKYGNLLLKEQASSYKLVGYCMGGLVAMEAARVLMEAGANVELLNTISTSFCSNSAKLAPEQNKIHINSVKTGLTNPLLMERAFGRMVEADIYKAGHTIEDSRLKEAVSYLAQKTGGDITEENLCNIGAPYEDVSQCFRKLVSMGQEERILRLYNTIQKSSDKIMEHEANMLNILFKVFYLNFQGVANYIPEPYIGDMLVMKCKEKISNFFPIIFASDEESWREQIIGDLKVEYIDGNHITCLQPMNIKNNAKFFVR